MPFMHKFHVNSLLHLDELPDLRYVMFLNRLNFACLSFTDGILLLTFHLNLSFGSCMFRYLTDFSTVSWHVNL